VTPFVVDLPAFDTGVKQVLSFNRYYGANVKRHLKSVLTDNCVVGSGSKIGAETQVEQSVIG